MTARWSWSSSEDGIVVLKAYGEEVGVLSLVPPVGSIALRAAAVVDALAAVDDRLERGLTPDERCAGTDWPALGWPGGVDQYVAVRARVAEVVARQPDDRARAIADRWVADGKRHPLTRPDMDAWRAAVCTIAVDPDGNPDRTLETP